MAWRGRQRERIFPVEITPMIDVVFLLVIFFMVTAQFAQISRAELDLPQERGEQREQVGREELIINLTREGVIIIAEERIELGQIEPYVRQALERSGEDPAAANVQLRIDRESDTRQLNDLVTRLQGLGVGRVRVATKVP